MPKSTLVLFATASLFAAITIRAADAPKPFDHGDQANGTMFQYKNQATVPENPPARPLAKLELKDKIYHGVLLNTDDAAGFAKLYKKYVDLVGQKPTMIGTFDAVWYAGKKREPNLFLERLQRIDSIPNVVPFIKLYTGDWKPGGPFLKADDILAGKEDAYFNHLADMSKQFGKPFLLSINHEMNGNWFFYSQGYRKGQTDWTPEKFVKIWRKIYTIFQDRGATNVAFAWCPGAMGKTLDQYDSLNSYKPYYPGNAYVDWVGASFYNDINHYALDNLAATYPTKPIILAEWGTTAQRRDWYVPKPYPGDVQHMQTTFDFCEKRYPNMKAITYFEWEPSVAIERVPGQVAVYRTEIAKPIFSNN